MSTTPFQSEQNGDASGLGTCSKLAVIGVAVTTFWVFYFFVVMPLFFPTH